MLAAGFDGYYGSFFNLKDWKTSKDLYKQMIDLEKKKEYIKAQELVVKLIDTSSIDKIQSSSNNLLINSSYAISRFGEK